ncbi:VOC family protein [Alicyclobacillus dauci]|uniref:VOC domain-containing protein n=1 Tax=Alicyclobacillus dauci TaxID=1475485 RepID=A0ABY6YYF9_9BACL|nr:VOC family protein [Alicyclobacillus dauci]WAH35655.1 hypothetical protein NZD86_15410 [Alicyclobacillus dauci]
MEYLGLTFTEIPVSNFDRSRIFYEEILRFSVAHLDQVNQWCLYTIPGSQTAVAIYTDREMVFDSRSPTRLVMEVQDLDKMIEYLERYDIELESVRVHERENFRITGFVDLDGNQWRVWSKTE